MILLQLPVERGSIIPLYSYPLTQSGTDAWKPLKDAVAQYPVEVWAIVNPNNGPGSSKDFIYATAISNLKKAGIKTLGYVYTNYTRRARKVVQTDMNNWKAWYKPHGIFFDEMTNDNVTSHINYYAALDAYAKKQGYSFTVGNPGSNVPLGYFEAVDTVMIYESSSYPSDNAVCNPKYNSLPGREALGMFPYNVPTLNETAILAAKECLGFIYATDDSGANPWDSLPPYLKSLFEILSRD